MRDKMSTEDTAESTGEQEGSSLPERLQSLNNEQLLQVTRQMKERRKAKPLDMQLRKEYVVLVTECARRGIKA